MIEEKKKIKELKELLNVYHFEQFEDQFDIFTEFTVVAKDEDSAWEQIKNLFNEKGELSSEARDFIDDRSKYEVTKLNLFKPTAIAHYSCG